MSVKVLLADASVSVHKVVELALAEKDFSLATAKDGEAALAKAKEFNPDYVLADVELPGINGYELSEWIKAEPELEAVQVILLKSSFATYDADRAAGVGANGMLSKPFSASALLAAIGMQTAPSPVREDATPGKPIFLEDYEREGEEAPPGSAYELEDFDQPLTEEESLGPEEHAPGIFEGDAWAGAPDRGRASAEEEEPFALDLESAEEAVAIEIESNADELVFHPPEEPAEAGGEAAAGSLELDLESSETLDASASYEAGPDSSGREPVAAAAGTAAVVAALDLDSIEAELVDRISSRVLERIKIGDTAVDAVVERDSAEEGRELIEQIVQRLSGDLVREVVWEVVPDMAERMIKEAIDRLQQSVR